MTAGPPGEAYWVVNARVPSVLLEGSPPGEGPDRLVLVDIRIEGGRVSALEPPQSHEGQSLLDQRDGIVLPGFVDLHTHIDKGHIWPRRPNPDGTFQAALDAVIDDRTAFWTAEDVGRRMEFSLRCALAHGTVALRTHLDSAPPQHTVSWPLFAELREAWSDRIALQAVSILGIERLAEGFGAELVPLIAANGGILGAVTYMVPELDQGLEAAFRLAAEHGLDLDFHSDETTDPAASSLRRIAETAIRHGFEGRIVCGHCCALASQDESEVDRTLDLVAEAGIAIVTLPLCNLFLQDRAGGRTPRLRGVTLLQEMRARGIAVAVASDNTRDPFYGYGDLDGLEVLREAVRTLQLDCPVGDWAAAVTRWPAEIMGLSERGRIAVGGPADMVLFTGRNYSELLSRPEAGRLVLRAGRAIDRTLPDYRELDDLMDTNSLDQSP